MGKTPTGFLLLKERKSVRIAPLDQIKIVSADVVASGGLPTEKTTWTFSKIVICKALAGPGALPDCAVLRRVKKIDRVFDGAKWVQTGCTRSEILKYSR